MSKTANDPILMLINEVRLLFNTSVELGKHLHKEQDLSMSHRALLEYLVTQGPSTVPEIALHRRVSRQRIQTLVNAMQKKGYVKTQNNPASQKSPLNLLTPSGTKHIQNMQNKEILLAKQIKINKTRVREASNVLREVRGHFESSYADN